MVKTFKYRLYPNEEQKRAFEDHFGCCRWIWNYFLDKRIKLWQTEKKSTHRFDLSRELPILKQKEETKWLANVNAQSLTAVLTHQDQAFTSFFKNKSGYPNFKKKGSKESFECTQGGSIDFEKGTLYVRKIPDIKIVLHREFVGAIKKVAVKKTPTDKYFAYVLVDLVDNKLPQQPYAEETTVGVDLGLTHFATLSTGEKIENPRFLKKKMKRLRRAHRRFDKKKKGSKNKNKARKKLAKIYEKVSNQRLDFHNKLSIRLIRENQAVAIETLGVAGLRKNRRYAFSINDVGWYAFTEMLRYKADWYGKTLLRIGHFEPSSKMCSCGIKNENLTIRDRKWTCSSCGTTHDRDILAAQNIKSWALHPRSSSIGQEMPESTPVEIMISTHS
jgi:putative transposase